VRFAFHPASLRAGAAVSIVGLFGLLGLAIAGRRRTVD
jgi:hypothetical protein